MRNTLLLQELREMLRGEHYDDLRAYCSSNTPQVIAGFLEALEVDEVVEIFAIISPEIAAQIFAHFEDEIKTALQDVLSDEQLSQFMFHLPDEVRDAIIGSFKDERQKNIEKFIEHYEKEEEKEVEELEIKEKGKLIYDSDGELLEKLAVYKTFPDGLKKIGKIEKDCWINVESPDQEEIDFLETHFCIPRDFLTASLDIDERARFEKEDGVTMIILRVPLYDEENTAEMYSTMAMGIILVGEVVITISARNNPIIEEFLESKVRNFSTERRDRFILKLIYRTTLLFLLYLKQINNITNVIQNKLQQSTQNKHLVKMLDLEKSLVYFTTSLKGNELLILRLTKANVFVKDEDNADFIEDIEIEIRQTIEMSQIYSNILSNMMGAFASIISNNLNMVMKFLTAVTIILTIPVSFTSLFSMNVQLPFTGPYAFMLIVSLSGLFIIGAIALFKKKNWF